jgi:hypothetical protein
MKITAVDALALAVRGPRVSGGAPDRLTDRPEGLDD